MSEGIMGFVRGMREMFPGGKKEKEKPISPEEIHQRYVSSKITQTDLFRLLSPESLPHFVEYHTSVVNDAGVDANPARGNRFKLNQLTNIIERGTLEKSVYEAHGIPVIRKQQN